jgi:chemotaxis protein MotB
MHRLPRLVPLVLLAALVLGGCTNYKAIAEEQTRAAERARAEATRLEAELAAERATREEAARAAESGTSATREELARARRELAEALQRESTTVVQNVRGETVDVLLTDVFFETASARLSTEGVIRLREVAAKLKQDYPGRLIRIEGFTDSRAIAEGLRDRFRSNWELSAARAAAVAIHLQWEHDLPGERIEIVGYGQYRTAPGNDQPQTTEAGRSANRVVRIAVLPEAASPEVIE